jgi:hypothetical protein
LYTKELHWTIETVVRRKLRINPRRYCRVGR